MPQLCQLIGHKMIGGINPIVCYNYIIISRSFKNGLSWGRIPRQQLFVFLPWKTAKMLQKLPQDRVPMFSVSHERRETCLLFHFPDSYLNSCRGWQQFTFGHRGEFRLSWSYSSCFTLGLPRMRESALTRGR